MSRDNGMNAMSVFRRRGTGREMEMWELTESDTSQTNTLPSLVHRVTFGQSD